MKNAPGGAVEFSYFETFLVGRLCNNLVIVRLRTVDGLSGLGEGAMQRQVAAAGSVELLAKRYVIGADPFEVERLA
jgi:L-alanine-DL-glutamate epimerase-like enolase superfamily enzyme